MSMCIDIYSIDSLIEHSQGPHREALHTLWEREGLSFITHPHAEVCVHTHENDQSWLRRIRSSLPQNQNYAFRFTHLSLSLSLSLGPPLAVWHDLSSLMKTRKKWHCPSFYTNLATSWSLALEKISLGFYIFFFMFELSLYVSILEISNSKCRVVSLRETASATSYVLDGRREHQTHLRINPFISFCFAFFPFKNLNWVDREGGGECGWVEGNLCWLAMRASILRGIYPRPYHFVMVSWIIAGCACNCYNMMDAGFNFEVGLSAFYFWDHGLHFALQPGKGNGKE